MVREDTRFSREITENNLRILEEIFDKAARGEPMGRIIHISEELYEWVSGLPRTCCDDADMTAQKILWQSAVNRMVAVAVGKEWSMERPQGETPADQPGTKAIDISERVYEWLERQAIGDETPDKVAAILLANEKRKRDSKPRVFFLWPQS